MSQTGKSTPWSEIHGGMRGSILLTAGAVITILAAAQNFAIDFMPEAPGTLVASAWLSWIMALWLLAAGFIWIGVHPFLGRFGLVVGSFHFLNGLFLLVVIFGQVTPFLPSVSLSIGRTLLLLFFVMLGKKHLRSSTVIFVGTIAFLHFLKISLRIMEILPSFGKIPDAGIDAGILILLAISVLILGRDIQIVENAWAHDLASNRVSAFDEFNNPEHEWNRSQDGP